MKRTILVTGASKGIGKAVALRLSTAGFTVVVHFGRDAEGAADAVQRIEAAGGEARSLSFDISDRESCRAELARDQEVHGVYYGAVLNAGVADDAAFPAMDGDAWDHVVRTNLDGFYNVLHPIVMPMVSARKGGRIVVMTSVSGLTGNRGQTNYSASKAGLIGAAKSLAVEMAKRDITVNCVAPGLIETQMLDAVPRDEVKRMIPMRRIGKPEDVAGVVAFLCSDEASYVTRQVISVNGGMF